MNCSLCRAPIADPKTAPTDGVVVAGIRTFVGRHCSDRCRDAVAATIAIRLSTVFASRELRERAERLADALLAAWRDSRGPEPSLVADAINRGSRPGAVCALPASPGGP